MGTSFKPRNRLADSVETAVNLSNGLLVVEYENETLPKNLENVNYNFFIKIFMSRKWLSLKKLVQDYSHLTLHKEKAKNVRE